MTKLFAICHNGFLDGDCEGDPMNFLDINAIGPSIRFDEALQLYRDTLEEDLFSTEEIDDALLEIKGAWIVTEDTTKLMEAVATAVDPGNDSGVYALQRALKAIANHLSVRNLGQDVDV